MLAISRFREVDEELAEGLRTVAEFWRSRPGCLGVDLVVNGNETKLLLTPVLLRAVDEPSAYLDPGDLAGDDDPWLGGS